MVLESHPREWNAGTLSNNIQKIRGWIADQYQELLKESRNHDKKYQKMIHTALIEKATKIYDESAALFDWHQTAAYIHRLILKYNGLMEG